MFVSSFQQQQQPQQLALQQVRVLAVFNLLILCFKEWGQLVAVKSGGYFDGALSCGGSLCTS